MLFSTRLGSATFKSRISVIILLVIIMASSLTGLVFTVGACGDDGTPGPKDTPGPDETPGPQDAPGPADTPGPQEKPGP